jgi:Flp pilus assembly protein TadB
MFKKGSKFPYIVVAIIFVITAMVFYSVSEEIQNGIWILLIVGVVVISLVKRMKYSKRGKNNG